MLAGVFVTNFVRHIRKTTHVKAGAWHILDMGNFIDTEVELPDFPQMNLVPGLETAADFNQPYYAHCKDVSLTSKPTQLIFLVRAPANRPTGGRWPKP